MNQQLDIDEAGWVRGAHALCSPNQDDRPPLTPISLLVLHNISLPPGEFGGPAVIDLFLNRLDFTAHAYYQHLRGLRVSSHFLIRRDGSLLQFVACLRRAWHAGVSSWCGRSSCNDFAIGIELEGTDDRPYEDAQYDTLNALTGALLTRYPIDAAVGHSDIAPGRKTDPGPAFDWFRYRAARPLSHRPSMS